LKQCYKVCKKPVCWKHFHKTSGKICNDCKEGPLTSLDVAIVACYNLLASQRFRYPKFHSKSIGNTDRLLFLKSISIPKLYQYFSISKFMFNPIGSKLKIHATCNSVKQ